MGQVIRFISAPVKVYAQEGDAWRFREGTHLTIDVEYIDKKTARAFASRTGKEMFTNGNCEIRFLICFRNARNGAQPEPIKIASMSAPMNYADIMAGRQVDRPSFVNGLTEAGELDGDEDDKTAIKESIVAHAIVANMVLTLEREAFASAPGEPRKIIPKFVYTHADDRQVIILCHGISPYNPLVEEVAEVKKQLMLPILDI